MNNLKAKSAMKRSGWAVTSMAFALAVTALAPSHVDAQTRLQAGVLACSGEGGWGAIITSKKTFRCTFKGAGGKVRAEYAGEIRKFGLDLGKTGKTALTWLVFGPEGKVGGNYVAGSLAGSYAGVGAEASAGLGVGANALVGGGANSFALQPVSIQVQTGVSVAAGVQTLTLKYVGPLN